MEISWFIVSYACEIRNLALGWKFLFGRLVVIILTRFSHYRKKMPKYRVLPDGSEPDSPIWWDRLTEEERWMLVGDIERNPTFLQQAATYAGLGALEISSAATDFVLSGQNPFARVTSPPGE